MSTAPKPPTKTLLGATWLSAGITIGVWAVTFVGSFVFSGIPAVRLPWYIGAGLIVMAITSYLGTRYAVQKHRHGAWWEGHGSCDDTSDDLAPLRRIKAELADLHQSSAEAIRKIEELTEAVFDLADVAGRPNVPAARGQARGSTYVSHAAQDDTVMLAKTESAETRVQTADRKPADPEAEARAQGYAEGYVDGIARRQEGSEN